MKTICTRTLSTLILIAGFIALTFALNPTQALASERSGKIHVIKECSQYTGLPGSFCTITYSNFPLIPVGSRVLYDQAVGIPDGLLDSNVIVDTGTADRAIGRCTLDLATNLGVCSFSDGTGRLAGFQARVVVSLADINLGTFHWRGTYSFAEIGKHNGHGDK